MRAEVPVDLLNPGQVFACLGLIELTERLQGHARGAFQWSDAAPTRFLIEGPDGGDPVDRALEFLGRAGVSAWAPPAAEPMPEKWQVASVSSSPRDPFPIKAPDSLATWPALLRAEDESVRIDHWGDSTKRDKVKFWAGAAGMPGARLLSDSLASVREDLKEPAARREISRDPFAVTRPLSSSFRFDWRGSYIPLEVGFSLNHHKSKMTLLGYPLVEILAAIGLSHARPEREARTKLCYRYGAVGVEDPERDPLLPAAFLRAALGAPSISLPFPHRRFCMRLGWPGQEGQARCITQVTEEHHA